MSYMLMICCHASRAAYAMPLTRYVVVTQLPLADYYEDFRLIISLFLFDAFSCRH